MLKKPLNRTKVAGTSLKERFCLTISTFSSALMKGPSSNIDSVVFGPHKVLKFKLIKTEQTK